MLKRSVSINGHRTSIALEAEFWDSLAVAAKKQNVTLPALVAQIDGARPKTQGLASAIRVWVLAVVKAQD